ncbi:MAG: cupredoxin domain-containing protein [Bryobacteraceae bacterium]
MRKVWLFLACCLCAGVFAQDRKDVPARTIAITAERFVFTPSKIRIKEGELVEFILTSEDTEHGFLIPGTSIHAIIPPRGKGELRVKFVANRKGEFFFECSRACGAGHNLMRGSIVVK